MTSLSNKPIRKNHGSISSSDSGKSEGMSYCEGNVYHLTSSILHNAPAPLPPRRHSAVQQGTNLNPYHQHMSQSNVVANSSGKQANGDISAMPPPPNPRSRNNPFPIPMLPPGANVENSFLYQQQKQLNQMRHAGKFSKTLSKIEDLSLNFSGLVQAQPARNVPQQRYHAQPHNLAEIARLQRLGRSYSHEGVIESSLGDIEIYYPDEDGKSFFCNFLSVV